MRRSRGLVAESLLPRKLVLEHGAKLLCRNHHVHCQRDACGGQRHAPRTFGERLPPPAGLSRSVSSVLSVLINCDWDCRETDLPST